MNQQKIGIFIAQLRKEAVANKTDTIIRIFGCSIGVIIILLGVYMNFVIKIYMNTNRVYSYMNEKFGHTKLFVSGIYNGL